MIVENLKADISEAAQEKIKGMVEQAIESKLKKEAKKAARRMTVKFIISGIALAGVILLASNAEKAVKLVIKPKS